MSPPVRTCGGARGAEGALASVKLGRLSSIRCPLLFPRIFLFHQTSTSSQPSAPSVSSCSSSARRFTSSLHQPMNGCCTTTVVLPPERQAHLEPGDRLAAPGASQPRRRRGILLVSRYCFISRLRPALERDRFLRLSRIPHLSPSPLPRKASVASSTQRVHNVKARSTCSTTWTWRTSKLASSRTSSAFGTAVFSAARRSALLADGVASVTHAVPHTTTTAERPPPRLAAWSNGREGGRACTTSPRHACC